MAFFDSRKNPQVPPAVKSIDPVPPVAPEAAQIIPPQTESRVESQSPAVAIMTEQDSYIRELIRGQDKDGGQDWTHVESLDKTGWHRLSLPDYFEAQSYDCTRGDSCVIHKKETTEIKFGIREVKILNRGHCVFRWVRKHKADLDYAKNVRRWAFVNLTKFREAPKEFFRASGAVEEGDAILMFMPSEVALKLREVPGQRSKDLLKGRMTKTAKGILMSGDTGDDRVYSPDLGPLPEEQLEDRAAQ